MKRLFPPTLTTLSLSVALITSCGAFGFRDPTPLDAQATDAATTALTSKILESSQFAHQQLDNDLAERFLDRYLDTLDGTRAIFLQSDIDEFATFRPQLAEATRTTGDTTLARLVFKRYLERLGERAKFISGRLAEGGFDFSTDETFSYDRKTAARPADIAAAKKLWSTQLRVEYLQEKLTGKSPEEITKVLDRRTTRTVDMMRKLDDKAVLQIYLESLAQVYDPHSDYMGPEQMKTFEIAMNLSLTGIGATLQSEDGYCKIKDLVPGGPAARSGLVTVGDRIVGVAQKAGDEFTDLIDLPLPQAVELIRGKKDTSVFLNIIPAGATDDSIRKSITIVRDEIKLEDQQAKAQIIELPVGDKTQRIGVIDLPAFYAGEGDGKNSPTSCSADVARLIKRLNQENITGLILDLRLNGGGSLQEAIDLTGLFIPSGPIVQTRSLEGRTEVGRDRDGKVAYDGPLVVLTSRFSASASEILAGALQDYGRAVVVGDTSTFGKGTVQTIVPLARIMQSEGILPGSDPGALKVTISKFYRPSGKSTQLEGVKSDIVIPSLTDMPEIGESDLQNPLPWDTIPAARYKVSNRVNENVLPALRQLSTKRTAADPEFQSLQEDITRFRKLREDKTVSLNEKTRLKEKEELAARTEAAKTARLARATTPPKTFEITLKNIDDPALSPPAKAKTPEADKDSEAAGEIDVEAFKDLILHEAGRILVDYTEILKRETVSKR